MVSATIRGHVDALDEWRKQHESGEPEEEEESNEEATDSSPGFVRMKLGARRPPVPISSFISQAENDPAFSDFLAKVSIFMKDLIVREHYAACERDGQLLRDLPQLPDVKSTDLVSLSNIIISTFTDY